MLCSKDFFFVTRIVIGALLYLKVLFVVGKCKKNRHFFSFNLIYLYEKVEASISFVPTFCLSLVTNVHPLFNFYQE
jgi:hypothetical protein